MDASKQFWVSEDLMDHLLPMLDLSTLEAIASADPLVVSLLSRSPMWQIFENPNCLFPPLEYLAPAHLFNVCIDAKDVLQDQWLLLVSPLTQSQYNWPSSSDATSTPLSLSKPIKAIVKTFPDKYHIRNSPLMSEHHFRLINWPRLLLHPAASFSLNFPSFPFSSSEMR